MKEQGITLVELLVVLLIIGIVASLAPAALQRVLPGQEIRAQTRVLADVLRNARTRAIRENLETTVTVDVDAKRFHAGRPGRAHDIGDDIEIVMTAAASEQIDPGTARIRFYPDGTSTGGQVTLKRGENRLDVIVDWLTGRVRIIE